VYVNSGTKPQFTLFFRFAAVQAALFFTKAFISNGFRTLCKSAIARLHHNSSSFSTLCTLSCNTGGSTPAGKKPSEILEAPE